MILSKIPNKDNAFTMVEVLITLGIIGVIAALTIPTLIKEYQKQQAVEQLKKAYSIVNQAVNTSIAENGAMPYWGINDVSNNTQQTTFVDTYIAPYLSVYQKCNPNYWNHATCRATTSYYLDKTTVYAPTCRVLRLNNGMDTCFVVSTWHNPRDLQISIDINGAKPPNLVGKDIFINIITLEGKSFFYPNATASRNTLKTTGASGCNSQATSHGGNYCGALILHDGWKISSDYPWN